MSQSQQKPLDSATPMIVLRQFRVIFGAIRSHFKQLEKQTGIGGAQVWALFLINQSPGIGIGHISINMDIHQSTASNLIKTLLQKKLVRLEKSIIDKRQVHLTIEKSGKDLLKIVDGPFEGVLPVALNNLNHSTLLSLNTDLGKLIQLLNTDDSAAETPLANL